MNDYPSRLIMLVLDAEAVRAEAARQDESRKQRGGNAAIMLEGALMRSGHVIEIHDMPRLDEGQLVLFTGVPESEMRKHHVRMFVNGSLFHTEAKQWFGVIVAVIEKINQWNHDRVLQVVKSNCRVTMLDLHQEALNDAPVMQAIAHGWERSQQMPMTVPMIRRMGTENPPQCDDPDCENCGDHNPKDG